MNRVIRFALNHRGLMVVVMGALFAAGVAAFLRLNIEAYPDPVPPLVEVVTQSTGQSAEEIERYITIPIEIQMAGIPHVTSVRSISLFGLSDVKIQFSYAFSYDEAEQRVINRLTQLPSLPGGAQPQISPESPIGEIYRYRLVGPPGYSVTDLKTLQDWVLERKFKSAPGVIDVTGWGGKTKSYDVTVDKNKLIATGTTLPQILQALNNSNLNVGGQTVNFGAEAAIVRGVGLIQSVEQIRGVALKTVNGVPVTLGEVATVTIGHLPRLGIAGQDGDDDIVQGIVLMHRGEKSLPTIRAVEAEAAHINSSGILPPGVHIEKIYDRSELIDLTTETVLHNMVMGVLLIFFVQWVFLGDLRSAVIVAATIPFALAFAVVLMVLRGESANLLSVGAVDFGLVVDATVILVESIFRHLGDPLAAHAGRRGRTSTKLQTIAEAAGQVNRAIFFAAAIIIASFLPLFMLNGVEGHIFGPMAETYAYAIAGGLIATFTISPALSALLSPDQVQEKETWVVRAVRRVYSPAIDFALRARIFTLGSLAILFVVTILCAQTLGLEFLPHLEEGNFWIRATMPQSVSLEAGDAYVNRIRAVMKSYPEVVTVISQHGRPDDGTDATGFFNAEFYVPLRPQSAWPRGMTKDKLTETLSGRLTDAFPGIDFNFSQNIQDNVEEAASGVKGENSVKLYGGDLATLESTAARIKAAMAKVKGVTDLQIFNSLGQPTVKIEVDQAKAARYGLHPGDVNAIIQTAIGGQAAGNLYEPGSDRNFPIMVRPGSQRSPELAVNPGDSDRDSEPGWVQRHPGAAERRGHGEICLRRRLRLSREPRALYSDQIQRPGPGSRRRGAGSSSKSGQRSPRPGRLPDGVGGRAGRPAERPGATGRRRADQHRFDHLPAVSQLLHPDRHALGRQRAAHGYDRGHPDPVFDPNPPQRLRRHRFCRPVRHLGDERHHHSVLLQSHDRRGRGAARGGPKGLRNPATTRADDLHGRLRGTAACSPLHRHRLAGAKAPRPGGGRGGGGRSVLDPSGVAGADRPLLPSRTGGASVSVGKSAAAWSWLAALTLCSCAVGPDFHRPPPPSVQSLTPPQSLVSTSIGPQQLIQGQDIPQDWWRSFHSPELDALIAEALKANSDLAAAKAALAAAHQTYLSAFGLLSPTVDASAASSRNKSSQYLSPPLNSESFYYSLQTAQLDISYSLDLFGGLRRQVEGAKAQEEAQRFQMEAASLALVSNVVVTAVQEASLSEQLSAQNKIITIETDILSIMRRQKELGQLGGSDVLAQEAALAAAEASRPPLQKALAAQEDMLAYLTGRTPGEAGVSQVNLNAMSLPGRLPLSLPSDLVGQRPDIRVAEANLHAASAAVGVAVAARLPALTLTASAGGQGGKWSQVFSSPDSFWSYGAGLTQPLLEGGALYRKQKASEALLRQARELYRSAVLAAFQNVSDVLEALQADQQALVAAEAAEAAAASSLTIARGQLSEGQIAGVSVLSSEEALAAAEQALVQARAARFTDTAALFQALGGGWWTRGSDKAS